MLSKLLPHSFHCENRVASVVRITSNISHLRRTLSYVADPRIGLNEEELEIQRTAKEFAMKELYPRMAEFDAKGELPMHALKKAGELGFGAICCDEKYGGSGMSKLHASLIFEQMGAGCISTGGYITIQNMIINCIDKYANEELKAKYLPDLATFDKLASYCLTEPGSGSDAAGLRTIARRDGDHYVVNGSKAFISGAGGSDVYLVMMRHADGARNRPGPSHSNAGTDPDYVNTARDCRVPVSNQVGGDNQGFTIAMNGLNGGRINLASLSLGGAQMSFDIVIEHAKVREMFGKTLSEHQWVQFKLAEMAVKLVTSRLVLREAARALDNEAPHAVTLTAIAKFYTTDEAFEVINGCLQLLGGYGILKDYPIQQYLRDCRVHQIGEGANEVMRMLIARNILNNSNYFFMK